MEEKLIRDGASFFGDAEPGYKTGELPARAPLAVGYVPQQTGAEPVYENADALARGTLFPGLDLPFMNVVNKGSPYAGTQLGELMAISFVAHELTLYLDTHTGDGEAFELLRRMLALKKEAHERYVRLHGPVSADDLLDRESFDWTRSPWPWETAEKGGGR
ncbi:MAG: spore coat protein CotJB [Oscillospiraceae bacterium]|nr:spore coat protein CotJB [Oscillospiraceae bacterium]